VEGREVMRNRRGVSFVKQPYVDLRTRAGTGQEEEEKPPGGTPGAAVHNYSLNRLNMINDFFKKTKISCS